MEVARVNRRSFLAGSIRLAAVAATGLLAACAPAAPAQPTAAPAKPTEAPKTAAPTSGPAATTAPAAPKPTAAPVAPTAAPATAPTAAPKPTVAAAPKAGGQLNWALGRFPITFNGLNPVGGIERWQGQLSSARLINFDVKRNVIPDLAEKWEISPDGTKYTFNLVKNARWSDGAPFTAKDVEFTYTWANDKKTGSILQQYLQTVKGAKEHADGAAKTVSGIKVLDDYTIQFELTEPDATFLSFIAGYYGPYTIPFHKLKDVPPDQFDQHEFNTKPGRVSLGPFVNTAREKDQFVEYTRNDNYFKGKPLLDKIVFRVMNADVGLAALQKGEVDIASVPAREAPNLRGNQKVRLFTYPVNLYHALQFNLSLPQFQDVRIRQAVLHAFDRKTYVDRVQSGLGEVWDSVIVQPDWYNDKVTRYAFDANKAKELLAAAKWDTNREVEFRYYATFKDLAPILQQSLANVGFKIKPVEMETATWVKEVPGEGKFEMSVVGGGGITDDPNELWDYFKCENWSRYCNQKVLDLFAQGRKVTDKAARKKVYDEVQDILNKDLPWMVIHSIVAAVGFTPRVREVAYSSYDYLYFERWGLEG